MGALLPHPQTAKKSTFSFRYRKSRNCDRPSQLSISFLKNSVMLIYVFMFSKDGRLYVCLQFTSSEVLLFDRKYLIIQKNLIDRSLVACPNFDHYIYF